MTAADRAAAERRDQGLPPVIEDPAVLANVAELVQTVEPRAARDAA